METSKYHLFTWGFMGTRFSPLDGLSIHSTYLLSSPVSEFANLHDSNIHRFLRSTFTKFSYPYNLIAVVVVWFVLPLSPTFEYCRRHRRFILHCQQPKTFAHQSVASPIITFITVMGVFHSCFGSFYCYPPALPSTVHISFTSTT